MLKPLKEHKGTIKDMKSQTTKEVIKQQDEIIGRLTREVEYLQDSQQKRNEWLAKAKKEAGFSNNISFDEVWKVALQAYKKSQEIKP